MHLGQADGRGGRLAHHVERVGAAQEAGSLDGGVEARVAAVGGDDGVGKAGDVVQRKVDGGVAGVDERRVFEELKRIVENEVVVVFVARHQDGVLLDEHGVIGKELAEAGRRRRDAAAAG